MKCEGNFYFKGIEEKKGGEFTSSSGQKIVYSPTYQLKVDEVINEKAVERTFKFSHKNNELFNKFRTFKLYDNILVAFDIFVFKNQIRLIPIDVICEHEPNE